jgi:nucleotide-binding universal stress UspA family protein
VISRLLVGLDGSPLAERVLPYAQALAHASGATVTLVQVVPPSVERERLQHENPRLLPFMAAIPGTPAAAVVEGERAHRHDAEHYLDAVAWRLGEAGVATEVAVVHGDPAVVLAEEARLRQANLILLSTHGRSGLGRWVFGSVAEGVLSHGSLPVLLARVTEASGNARLPGPMAPIVVPLDGSALAERAIPVAATLARALSAELRLARMVAPTPVADDGEGDRLLPTLPDLADDEHAAREYVAATAVSLRHQGLVVRGTVGLEDPAPGIVAVAEESEAGLIVMATHGRTGVERALLGSVALEVLHRGTLPVVFAPARSKTA